MSLSTMKYRLSTFHIDPSAKSTGLTSNVTVHSDKRCCWLTDKLPFTGQDGGNKSLLTFSLRSVVGQQNWIFYISILKKNFLFSLVFSSTLCRTLRPATSTNQRRAVMSASPMRETIPSVACPIEMLERVQ